MGLGPFRLIPAVALAACAQAAVADWQCQSPCGVAQAASEYLDRAERVYPSQLLAVVRAAGRTYLVNARDEGWSERVRQGLMELRLAEPDITAARRFDGVASGVALKEIPPGEFVCLERNRAARHGLASTGRGDLLLAAGKSVHLVDPREPAIMVEVRAVGSQPLDFREILALSGRSGIYAGLAGGRAPTGTSIAFGFGPSERPGGEIVVTPRAADIAVAKEERVEAAGATGTLTAPPDSEQPPARVEMADVPAAPPPGNGLPRETPAAAIMEVAKPVSSAAPVGAPASQGIRIAAGQSDVEYAKVMKAMMALRRSGSVRSISERTYVHPAVEEWRVHR